MLVYQKLNASTNFLIIILVLFVNVSQTYYKGTDATINSIRNINMHESYKQYTLKSVSKTAEICRDGRRTRQYGEIYRQVHPCPIFK